MLEHVQRVLEHVQRVLKDVQRVLEHLQRVLEHTPRVLEHLQGVLEHTPRVLEHLQRVLEHLQASIKKTNAESFLRINRTDIEPSAQDIELDTLVIIKAKTSSPNVSGPKRFLFLICFFTMLDPQDQNSKEFVVALCP